MIKIVIAPVVDGCAVVGSSVVLGPCVVNPVVDNSVVNSPIVLVISGVAFSTVDNSVVNSAIVDVISLTVVVSAALVVAIVGPKI